MRELNMIFILNPNPKRIGSLTITTFGTVENMKCQGNQFEYVKIQG